MQSYRARPSQITIRSDQTYFMPRRAEEKTPANDIQQRMSRLLRLYSKHEFLRKVFFFLLFIACARESATSVAFDYVPQPEFLESAKERNVTSYVGHTTRLPCTIRHLGTKRVSWIRGRDLQVLTSGRTSFATNIRISVLPGTGASKKYKRDVMIYPNKLQVFALSNRQWREKREAAVPLLKNSPILPPTRPVTSLLENEYMKTPVQHPISKRNIRKRELKRDIGSMRFAPTLTSNGNHDRFYNVTKDYDVSYQGSILIHPSGNNAAVGESNGKRTIIPYNYLDGVWEPEDFTLQIKYAKEADAGDYICQINTEPRMTQLIRLKVVDMVAEIVGRKELFVKEGSSVKLLCKVSHDGVLPGFIFWYKDDRLVDYDNSDGRIQIKTNPHGGSVLQLRQAVANDSANYTCEPSGGKPASAILTIIVDERPAAMQKENAAIRYPGAPFLLYLLLVAQSKYISIGFTWRYGFIVYIGLHFLILSLQEDILQAVHLK